jgi:hypothetical protein
MTSDLLLQYRSGAWTPVGLPFGAITDIAPVGADDLWIASGSSETPIDSELAHYQAGKWSVVPVPTGVTLSHLHANAPSDIYAMGSVQAASGWRLTRRQQFCAAMALRGHGSRSPGAVSARWSRC